MLIPISNLEAFYHAVTCTADVGLTLPCRAAHVSIQRMRRLSGRIRAHTLNPGGKPALRVELKPGDIPAPGQPLLAYLPSSKAPLRSPIFPAEIHSDGITSTELPSPYWTVGTDLDLLGPIGYGFSPAPGRNRWVLLSLGRTLDRLLPLVDDAIDRDIAIAAYSDGPLPSLPAEVEIGASPDELVQWADYIAVDVQNYLITSLRELLGGEIRPAAEVEMLVDMALPCGLGVCGACAALSRKGWKLACQDGPVFQWNNWIL